MENSQSSTMYDTKERFSLTFVLIISNVYQEIQSNVLLLFQQIQAMNFNQNLSKLAGATALQINSDSIYKLKQENTTRSGRSHIVSFGTQLQENTEGEQGTGYRLHSQWLWVLSQSPGNRSLCTPINPQCPQLQQQRLLPQGEWGLLLSSKLTNTFPTYCSSIQFKTCLRPSSLPH